MAKARPFDARVGAVSYGRFPGRACDKGKFVLKETQVLSSSQTRVSKARIAALLLKQQQTPLHTAVSLAKADRCPLPGWLLVFGASPMSAVF